MKEKIRELFLNLGADICGFAHIDRFSEAPEGFRPTDIYDDCRSAIVFAKAIPKGLTKVSPRIIYKKFNGMMPGLLDNIAYQAAMELERYYGATAVPVPADDPYDYWDEANQQGRGVLSMRHAAWMAGLGTLGKNTLLLNEDYGNRLCIGAVLTDLELASDPLAKEQCLPNCRICLDSCPFGSPGRPDCHPKPLPGAGLRKKRPGFCGHQVQPLSDSFVRNP